MGPKRRIQVVHQGDVGRVVEAGARVDQAHLCEDALGGLVALLGEVDLPAFFIQRVVARLGHTFAGAGVGLALLTLQARSDPVHCDVLVGLVLGLAADDQRRAGLVDQDGVHLVDDRVLKAPLHPVGRLVDHVVTQVVEAELVVGAVGDVGAVGRLLLLAGHLRQVHTHRQPQEVVQAPHPLGITIGQVVVDGDHVHALPGQGIEVDGQGGGKGLALAGAHLGDLALVQGHRALQLDVEVAHLHGALGALAHHCKGLGQERVKGFALGDTLAELVGLGAQGLVVELLEVGLQGIDALHRLAVLLEQPVVARAEDLSEEVFGHEVESPDGTSPQTARRPHSSTRVLP